MVLCYCLALVSLSVLLSLWPASGQGVFLEYNGFTVPNFLLMSHEDIDLGGDERSNVGLNLVCRTDNTTCCRNDDNPNGLGFGDWYYPDGVVVAFSNNSFSMLPSGQIYRMLRYIQIVRLRRDGSATVSTANGLYRCEVPNQNGVIQTRYVGLYTDGAGVVSVSGDLQLCLMNVEPSRFALTAITTGGPPTNYTWSGPGGDFSNADSTMTVQDGRTASVRIELMVTGSGPGMYTFTVSNPRTPNGVTAMLTVSAGDRPNNLNAVQEGNNIRITWSAPDSGAPSNGYIVYYQAGSGQVLTEQTPNTEVLLTTNLINGAEYTIEVTAVADLPGVRAGPERVVFRRSTRLMLLMLYDTLHPTVRAPDPPEVTLSAVTATGVTVAWNLQEGVDQYEVRYNRTMGSGQLGACPDFADSGSQTTGGEATSLTLQDIEEFSTYEVMVVAVNRIARVPSVEMELMTLSAVPSPPTAQVACFTNTTITISWMLLSCIEVNSESTVTDYTLRYGRVSSSDRTTENLPASSTTFTVSNLEPGTRYSIEVAAVNSNGTIGAFSNPTTQFTDQDNISRTASTGSSITAAVVLGVVLLLSLLLNAATIPVLVLKCRQSHTPAQQELNNLSDAKISTAACEAYVAVQPAHGPQREAPQYEDISPQSQHAQESMYEEI